MTYPVEQVERLKERCERVAAASEGGILYLMLFGLRLPAGCTPSVLDALLCPTTRDGYNSRLFFAERPSCAAALNWNGTNVRILERNWFAFSWSVRVGLALDELLTEHLAPLRA